MAFPRTAPKELLLECPASESGFQRPRANFKEPLASASGEVGTLVLEAEACGEGGGAQWGTLTQLSGQQGP